MGTEFEEIKDRLVSLAGEVQSLFPDLDDEARRELEFWFETN